MTIVDSSVWIDYLSNHVTAEVDWLDRQMRAHRMGLTDLILYEVLQGAKGDVRFAQVREALRQFEVWPTMSPGTESTAAENYRFLRKKGITIRKAMDCLIATFCIEGRHELLHNDRDFDPFEKHLGLKVVHVGSRRI